MRSIDDHGQLLLRATDILVPARLGGPLLRRVARDVVAPARHSLTYGDRVRATRLALPTDTVLCGTTAAWIHGVDQASAAQPVEVGARHGRRVRSVDGRTSRGRSFHPDDVQDSDWGLVTTPARTAYDLARDPVLLRSVPRLDALVRATTLSVADVWPVVERNPGARWITMVPRAFDLVDAGAESVRESMLRVLLALEGFPRLVTQHALLDAAGAFVARLDLANPELRVGVEYDGAYHLDPDQAARDRWRRGRVRANGWGLLVVDDALFTRREALYAAVAALFEQAKGPRW
jgi:very-short-patch-repair endonuclease